MFSKKIYVIVLLLLSFLLYTLPICAEGVFIAVMPFEEGNLNWRVFDVKEVLNGITQMVTNQLVDVEGIRVVERSQLEKILKEQNFSRTGLVDPATASEIGKLLGVDALILGTVKQMEVKESGSLSIGPFKVSGIKATVNLGARIVSVETAEILASFTGEGESSQASVKVSDLQGISFGTKAFSDSVVGKSIQEATEELVSQVSEKMKNWSSDANLLEGLVLKVLGDKLVINIGSAQDLKNNQIGELIRLIEVEGLEKPVSMPIGKVQVFSVDESAAIVQVLESNELVQIGDVVRFNKL